MTTTEMISSEDTAQLRQGRRRVRSGRLGGGLAALLGAALLAGCGGTAAGSIHTNSLAAIGSSNSVTQEESAAIKALAPTLHRSGVSEALAQRAAHGGLTCPKADRGADVGTATFTFGPGNRVSSTEDACPVVEAITGHPELSYHGPGGCRGQFFVGDGTDVDPAGALVDWFRYGAHDAYIVGFGNQVFHFATAPRISHGLLVFDHDFGNEHIVVTVKCPPPHRSGWLLPASA